MVTVKMAQNYLQIFVATIFFSQVVIQTGHAGLLGNARIIDGTEVTGRKLYEVFIKGEDSQCTGALIHRKWVLTTAQCAKMAGFDMMVAYGQEDVQEVTDAGPSVQDSTPTGVKFATVLAPIIHPSFNPATLANNIALIELVDYATDAKVQLVKIPRTPRIGYESERATVSGWGAEVNYGKGTNLREKIVSIVDNSQCSKAGYPVPKGPMICSRGRSLCEFDYGAPLVFENQLIGLGTGNNDLLLCESMTYATFTNIGYYYSWIRTNTKNSV